MMARLTETQAAALAAGSPRWWRGHRETGVQGSTMDALERRGLATARFDVKPYRRMVYRLTPAGVRAQLGLHPLSEWTDEQMMATYIDGSLSHEDYIAERDRRGRVLVIEELRRQMEQAFEDAGLGDVTTFAEHRPRIVREMSAMGYTPAAVELAIAAAAHVLAGDVDVADELPPAIVGLLDAVRCGEFEAVA